MHIDVIDELYNGNESHEITCKTKSLMNLNYKIKKKGLVFG